MKINDFTAIDWTFKGINPRPGRHRLHSYPATMHASCVENCLNLISNINTILDPFGGSGTVALESMKKNKFCFTNDLNPLACLITNAKLKFYDDVEIKIIKEVIDNLTNISNNKILVDLKYNNENDFIKQLTDLNLDIPKFKNISYWFQPQVASDLAFIKKILPKNDFFNMSFSEVVRIVSNRRCGEFKLFRRPKEELNKYKPETFDEMIRILKRNLNIILDENISNQKYKITNNNTKILSDVPDESIDLVITSPPYGDSRTTVSYGQFSRLSLQWLELGGDVDNLLLGGKDIDDSIVLTGTIKTNIDQISKIDSKRGKEVENFYKDLSVSFNSIDKKCHKNTYHVWIVGNRLVKGVRTQLDMFIKEYSQTLGYCCIGIFPRKLPYKSMPKQNSPTNTTGNKSDTMCEENLVILKKL